MTPWTVVCQAPLPWDSPGKNIGVGCHALLQGIFSTLRSNLGLLHWQADSLQVELPGKPVSCITTLLTLLYAGGQPPLLFTAIIPLLGFFFCILQTFVIPLRSYPKYSSFISFLPPYCIIQSYKTYLMEENGAIKKTFSFPIYRFSCICIPPNPFSHRCKGTSVFFLSNMDTSSS